MFDIPFHINLFISLIEIKHPLKTSSKITHVALPIYFFNWSRISITLFHLFISLIDVENPLKTSNKKHTCKFKIHKITYSKL